jgi:putative membrane protein
MPDLFLNWQLDPVLLGGLLTLSFSYTLLVSPLRSRLAPNTPFPWRKSLFFYAGIGVMYLAEGSPLHDLAERYLFSAHMIQHLIVNYCVASLILWGLPTWILRPMLLNSLIAPISRFITKPLVALLLFNLLFSVWHLPVIYDSALRNGNLHHFEHLIFLAISLLFWWPLMSPLPELPRASGLVQLLYLFTTPLLQLPLFAIVTFAGKPLYETYAIAPQLWLSAVDDQALGGAMMKVLSLFGYGIPFVIIFFRWYRQERQQGQHGSWLSPGSKNS